MRNSQSTVSIALLAVAAIGLSGCASTPANRTCAEVKSHHACASARSAASAYGPVSSAPEVQAAEMLSSAAAAEIERALASTRPDLEFRAGLSATTHYIAYAGQPSGAAYSYALGLSVPLYEGGSEAIVEVARAEHRVSQEAVADRRVSVAYEIAISQLSVRQQRDVIAILDRQRHLLGSLRSGLDAELVAGAASRVDLDDIERQLAQISVVRERAELALTQASTTLGRLGVPQSGPLPDISRLGLGENEQALVELALQNNPRIRQSAAQVAAAAFRVDQAQGAFQPTVAAQLEVYSEDVDLAAAVTAPHARATLQVSLPFDLSGAGKATLRQRADQMQAAQFTSQAVRDGVSAAVRTAFSRRQQARQLWASAQQEIQSASSLLEAVKAERQVGERTTQDEIRALDNLTSAQLNLAAAQFELRAAEYSLAAETGLIVKLFETLTQSAAL